VPGEREELLIVSGLLVIVGFANLFFAWGFRQRDCVTDEEEWEAGFSFALSFVSSKRIRGVLKNAKT
jgi:hypothetical protein